MRSARLLLERLTEIIPPAIAASGVRMRHNLTIDESGNLVLHFMLEGKFVPVIIEDEDLDKPVHQLVNEIELALNVK
jgi:hypothetical protein